MEEKLVRFTAVFVCAFSLFACVAVWFLPSLEQSVADFYKGIISDRLEREQRYAMLEQMSGLEIMDYYTQQAQQEYEEQVEQQQDETEAGTEPVAFALKHQMQLELPKGVKGKDVEVVPHHVDKQIEIVIPGADENYIYDYQLIGDSDAIQNLDYSSADGNGAIMLTMDHVVEVDSSFDKDFVYLDFFAPKEVYKRIVVVDAGHGGDMPGAVSGEHYEKNITLAIVQQIKALFDSDGDESIGVYYTRLDDTNPELASRVALANDVEADLFVSVHINSTRAGTDVEGVEVMYDEMAEDTAFDTKDFAQICLDESEKALGAKRRSLVPGHKIYIIRNSNAPAALIEVGFITNPNELAKMLTEDYQKKAAQGVYQAVKKSMKSLDKIEKK